MNFTATYCSVRRDLEERSWALVSRHAALTELLLQSIGTGHQAFIDTLAECKTSSAEVVRSSCDLSEHRRDHGC